MDFDEPGWPLIDDFFSALGEGRTVSAVRRYTRVRLRLYDFLDVDDMVAWLGPDDATLLAAEREFLPDGAVWNLFGLDGVLRCLPGFVCEARLPGSAAEARMQVSVIKRLFADLRKRHLVPPDSRRSFLAARRAVLQASVDLEQRLSGTLVDPRDHVLGKRFRQEPGPRW